MPMAISRPPADDPSIDTNGRCILCPPDASLLEINMRHSVLNSKFNRLLKAKAEHALNRKGELYGENRIPAPYVNETIRSKLFISLFVSFSKKHEFICPLPFL